MAYPGRGVIYNIVTKFEEQEAAYVPIATYGCDFFSNVDGCGRLRKFFSGSSIIGLLINSILKFFWLI